MGVARIRVAVVEDPPEPVGVAVGKVDQLGGKNQRKSSSFGSFFIFFWKKEQCPIKLRIIIINQSISLRKKMAISFF